MTSRHAGVMERTGNGIVAKMGDGIGEGKEVSAGWGRGEGGVLSVVAVCQSATDCLNRLPVSNLIH